jgi:hypothetical protein
VRVTNVVRPPEPVPAFEPVALAAPEEPDEEPPPSGAAAFARSGKDDPTRSQSERWRAALETVRETSTRLGASLSHARVLWLRPGDICVGYVKASDFHRAQLSGAGKATVEQALSRHFGRPTVLTVDPRPEAAETALPSVAEQAQEQRAARDRGADQKVRAHPALAAILRTLGGEIEHIQVLEPERPAAAEPLVEPEERN